MTIEGEIEVNGERLSKRDALGIGIFQKLTSKQQQLLNFW